jgi:hypothetical protein
MGVLRVERDPPTGIAARVGGVAWRDFDLQLFVYAVLLATLGLTMAYSNTAAQLGGEALRAGPPSSAGSSGLWLPWLPSRLRRPSTTRG